MNKILKIFNHDKYGYLRATIINKVPMYAFKDICKILEIKNYSDAKLLLNQNGVAILELIEAESKQKVMFIDEANMQRLYKLSDKEDITDVIDWIVGIVVSRTRIYGDYTVDELMADPDLIVKILNENADLGLKIKLLENKITTDSYRVKTYNSYYGERESVPLMFLANYLEISKISQTELMKILRGQEVVQPNDIPYQKYIDCGYFKVDIHSYSRNGEVLIRQTPIVYKPGINFIKKILLKMAGENDG